jgi:hypothetical protein
LKLDKFERNVTLLHRVCQVMTAAGRDTFFLFFSNYPIDMLSGAASKIDSGLKGRVGGRCVGVRDVMQDKKIDLYDEAHLLVAAIRMFNHLNSRPPTVEDLVRTIHISIERGNLICRRLEQQGIIEAVAGSYGARWYIKDHLKIEDIPRGEPESKLGDELKKFQDSQKALSQKIESMKAEQQQKKKNLFADMEKKLKEEMEKKRRK